MRPWAPTQAHIVDASQRRVLRTINGVMEALKAAPLARLGQLFDVAEPTLVTFQELDHYPQRRNGRYWGVKPGFAATRFDWPPGEGPRIFGYLRAAFGATPAAMAALKAARARVVIYCPDASAEWRDRFAASHLSILGHPVNLNQAGAEADAAVLYGQHATTATLLRRGVPVVLAPETVEQAMLAHQVDALGAGYMVGPHGKHPDVASALAALASSGDRKAMAMAFATKYAEVTPERVADLMADRALRLAQA
jgi:UDP:flavonoid glycosyltransferase YjiC (YdhE family)